MKRISWKEIKQKGENNKLVNKLVSSTRKILAVFLVIIWCGLMSDSMSNIEGDILTSVIIIALMLGIIYEKGKKNKIETIKEVAAINSVAFGIYMFWTYVLTPIFLVLVAVVMPKLVDSYLDIGIISFADTINITATDVFIAYWTRKSLYVALTIFTINLITYFVCRNNLKECTKLEINYVKRAIELSKLGTFPYGAVVVKDNKIIGEASSGDGEIYDPTNHAETLAIRRACQTLYSSDLSGCTLYSSCEPCFMCFGTIWWSNIGNIVYATSIKKSKGVLDTGIRITAAELNKKTGRKVKVKGRNIAR